MRKLLMFDIIDIYIKKRKVNIELSLLQVGVQKLQYILSQYNYNPKITFFAAPDFSLSLNNERTRAGFCIGGILNWGNGTTPIIPLELMSNSCGTLLAEIKENIDNQDIVKRICNLKQSNININGLNTIYDISYKNHFINIYSDGEKKYAIIHSSLPEVKADNILGTGVYFTESKKLQKEMKIIHTPFGILRILHGRSAKDYFSLQTQYAELSKVKRKAIMNELFLNFDLISNENHLGFINMNTCKLGCYAMNEKNIVLPITIGIGKSAYLVEPQNIQFINELNLFVVPHGSGHKVKGISKLEIDNDTGLFSASHGSRIFVFSDMTALINSYNEDKIITNKTNHELFKIITRVEPLFESKIDLFD